MTTTTQRALLLASVLLIGAAGARAADGTWTNNTTGGPWNSASNWAGTIADGSGFTADFSTLNITAHRYVTNNTARTIGHLRFGDRQSAATHDWTLRSSGGNALTLSVAAGSPTITVTNRTFTNACTWAGTQGFSKQSVGTLVLSTNNSYSGITTNRGGGEIRMNHAGAFGASSQLVLIGDANGSGATKGSKLGMNAMLLSNTISVIMTSDTTGDLRSTIYTVGGSNTVDGLLTLEGSGNCQITCNNAAHTLVINGRVTNTPPFTGSMFVRGNGPLLFNSPSINLGSGKLSKTDGNVVTLNTTGHDWASTEIANGTIRLGISDALPTARNFIMGQTGTDTPILDLAGFNQTLDSLNVNTAELGVCYIGNSSLTSDSILTYASSSNTTFRNLGGTSYGVLNDRVGATGARTLGLTVQGGGSLTLTSTNTYSGPTRISGNASRLTVSAGQTGGGTFALEDGTTLGVTLQFAGQTLPMAALSNGVSTEVTNVFNLGSGNPVAPVVYATNLVVGATIRVNVSGTGMSVGQFPLIQYETASGLTDSSFVADVLPAGVLGYASNNTGSLSVDLVVTQAPYIVWQGLTNDVLETSWDIGVTTNWFDPIGVSTVLYADGQAVRFDDNAPGTNLVIPASAVAPSGVTVDNTNKNYTFSGSFPIAGSGRLTKDGPGSVAMGLTNTYGGDTLINAGVFQLAANNVIPDGAGKGNVALGGVLDLAGLADTINGLSGGGVVTNSSAAVAALTVGNNNAASAFTGALLDAGAGALSLTKVGSGLVTLSGNNTFAGNLAVSGAGRLELAGPATTTGSVTLASTLRLLSSMTNSGVFALTAASVIEVDSGATAQFSGFTGGVFTLRKIGGGTLLLTNGAATLGSFHTERGTTIVDNISMSNTAFDSIGRVTNDNGTLIVRGSSIIREIADFNVGDVDNSIGRMFIQDSAQLLLKNLWLGKNNTSQGYVYQTGGVVTNAYAASADWRIAGNGTTAAGTIGGYYMSGGQVDVLANFQIGAYGYGEMIISGGVVNAWAGVPVVGRFAGGTGRLEVVGGTFYHKNTGNIMIIGEAGVGTATVGGGGQLILTNSLCIGGATGTGTVNLAAGGLIVAPTVREFAAGAISTFNFDGGVLQATTSNNPAFLQGLDAANVLGGGAVVDSAGRDITIGQALLNGGGGGGLVKLGAGTLTMTGASTYAGATIVSQGTLRVSSLQTGGGSVTVEDGTTFGAGIATTGTTLAASSLTLGASGATALELGLNTFPSPTIGVISATNFTVNGTSTVYIGGYIPPGSTRLIDYTGSVAGAGFGVLGLGPLPKGIGAMLTNDTTAEAVDLLVTNITPLVWSGGVDTNWDINATLNWEYETVADVYSEGTYVLFDDSGIGPVVNVVSNVSPGNVVVSNEVNPYLIGGTGAIAGYGMLLKQGAATLTLRRANTYLGDTRILGGVVVVSNAAALGASPGGTWVIDGGSLDIAGLALDARLNPVRVRGAGAGGAGAIFSSAGSQQLDGIRQLFLDGDATLSAPGARWDLMSPNYGDQVDLNGYTLTKIGPAYLGIRQLTITNSGSFSILQSTCSFTRCIVDGPGVVGVAPGATLQFENYTTNYFLKAIASTGGVISCLGSSLLLGSPVELVQASTFTMPTNITLNVTNIVSGADALIKTSPGILLLSNANTYAGGTLLDRGQITVGNNQALGLGAVTNTAIGSGTRFNLLPDVDVPNTLVINANDPAVGFGTITGPGVANTTGTWSGPITVNAGPARGGTFVGGGGVLRLSGPITGSPDVRLSQRDGVVVMAGGGSADSIIITGTLLAGADDGMPTNMTLILGGSAACVVDLNGYNQRVGALARNGNLCTVTNTGAGTVTLTLDAAGTTNVTYIGSVGGNLNLRKIGPGSQTLTGNNYVFGSTTVSQGTLRVGTLSAGGGAYAVDSGARLAVQVLATNATLAMSNLTLGADGSSSSILEIATSAGIPLADTNNPANAPITATNLTVEGLVAVDVFSSVAPLSNGQVVALINYSNGTLSGAGAIIPGALGHGATGYIETNTTDQIIYLVVTNAGSPNLVWTGVSDTNWDLATTLNWRNDGSPSWASLFYAGDAALFDDTLTAGRTNINLTTALTSTAVAVSNDANDYVFAGSGRISGGATLSKTGSALLRVNTTNDFTGGVTVSGGTLVAGNAKALGNSATATISGGGTLDVNGFNLSSGRVYTIAGAGVGGAGAIVNNGSAEMINAVSNLALSADATIGGLKRWDVRQITGGARATLDLAGNTLTKVGTNQISLVTGDMLDGNVVVNEGMFSIEVTSTATGGVGTITANTGAIFQIYQNPPITRPITLAGGILRQTSSASTPGSGVDLGAAGGTIDVPGSGLVLTNPVTGVGGLTKTGANTLQLLAVNSFQGGANLASGTVRIVSDDGLGDATGALTFSGPATLNVTNIFTLSPTRVVTLNAAASFSVDVLSALTIGQGLGGSGSLTKSGVGSLTLSGPGAYPGGTLLSAGTLRFGHDEALGAGTLTLNGGTTFAAEGGSRVLSNAVAYGSGAGNITLDTSNGALRVTAPIALSASLELQKRGANELRFASSTPSHIGGGMGLDILSGPVVLDGAEFTNENDGVRLQAGGTDVAELLLTNGAVWTIGTLGGNVNLVLGSVANNTGSNIAHIASGTVRFGSFGRQVLVGNTASTTGEVIQTGGLVTWQDMTGVAGVSLGVATGARGEYRLSGGILETPRIYSGGAGSSFFRFDGGTLRANTNTYGAGFVSNLTEATVLDGGAVIDTAGWNVTIGQQLLNGGSGGLTKQSAGVLTLTTSSTYIGWTTIAGGTLALGADGALASSAGFDVQAGATADVSAVTGGFVLGAAQTLKGNGTVVGPVASSGTLTPGASIGALTFTASLAMDASAQTVMEIDTGASPSNDQAAVAGALTYGGALTVTNLGPAATTNDSFTLFTATSFSGWFSSVALPPVPEDTAWDTNKLQTTGILDVYLFSFSTQELKATKNTMALLAVAKVTNRAYSSRGTVRVASVSASSAMSGTVTIVGTNIQYTPPVNYVGPDSFTCVLDDGHGSITVTIDVTVMDDISGNILPLSLSGGNVLVRYLGIPGTNYVLQSATNIVTPPVTWLNRVTNTAPTNGLMSFLDTTATNIYLQYYRTLVP